MSEPGDVVVRIPGMRWLLASLLTVVLAAACGTPAGSGSVPLASDGNAAASPSGTPQPASRTASGTPAAGTPPTTARAAFLSHVFTDVRDGKQFTLSDFQGKQVFVIGMAVW